MITISQHYNKWRMKFSYPGTGTRGYSVDAENFAEIVSALEHHLVPPGHPSHCTTERRDCPLCRKSTKENP